MSRPESGAGGERIDWQGRPVEEWRRAWQLPRLLIFAQLPSTNDLARELAEAGAPAGTTVLADHQTRGRGQRGRDWQAPPERGVLLSVVLRPTLATASAGALPIRVGLAAARAVEEIAHVAVGLKWPNDLWLGNGKLGGVLCEGTLTAGAAYAVAGVGLNVLQQRADFPSTLEQPATSLALEGVLEAVAGREPGFSWRAALAGALARGVATLGSGAADPLSAGELREYAARDILRGRPVTLDGRSAGTAAGLAADGSLLLETPEGTTAVRTGTVRAAPAPDRSGP